MTLNFNITGSITQEIELIDPSYTEEMLFEEFRNGTALTTLGTEGLIYSMRNIDFKPVAKVIYQKSNDDMEITFDDMTEE